MFNSIRPIAIYLPQFHPIPENDEWWGKGFTEWTNVTKAKPLFKNHYQPHLPADLGFYDLRLAEVREAQAALAKEYGIYGFCYYHYWFNGRRILERPFQEVFESGKPDFPFMLCWANENWTRIWDGGDKNILLEQNYSLEDDRLHIQSLIPYFLDDRYIKVDGKPVFAVYRSTLLPDPIKTTDIWRQEAAKHGVELYICRFETFGSSGKDYITEGGFDASIDFQPVGTSMPPFKNKVHRDRQRRYLPQKIHNQYIKLLKAFDKEKYNDYHQKYNGIMDYAEYIDFVKALPIANYKLYPGISPSWDNSARKKQGYYLLKDSSPALYAEWLDHVINNFIPFSANENFLFINAWNEWAEGNHLEPCQKWGKKYLEATRQVLKDKQIDY